MREYPNVWPEGGVFAFSAADGAASATDGLVARGLYRRVGLRLMLRPRISIAPVLDGKALRAVAGDRDYIFSDCWRVTVQCGNHSGLVLGAFHDNASICLRVAFRDLPPDTAPFIVANMDAEETGGVQLYTGKECYFAVDGGEPGMDRLFGLAVSYSNAEDAIARAAAAREANIKTVVSGRLEYHEDAPIPEDFVGFHKRLYLKAVSIQKANIVSPLNGSNALWFTADRASRREASVWDTAFQSMGMRHIRSDLAESALQAIFARQGPHGKIAASLGVADQVDDNDPVHPPLLAWAAWHVFDASGRGEFLNELYDPLTKYLAWFHNNRRNAEGLFSWHLRRGDDPVSGARGYESFMTNSPRFDAASRVSAVDLASYMAGEFISMEKIARALNRAADAQAWRERHATLIKRINEAHWDEFDRFYYDLDEEGEFIAVKTVAGLLPMHGRVPDRDQVEGLRLHLTHSQEFTPYIGISSVSKDEESYCADTWRGPAWFPVNLMLHYGLLNYGFVEDARSLANMTIQEAGRCYKDHGCIYEYYDPDGNLEPFMLPRQGKQRDEKGNGEGVREDNAAAAGALLDLMRQVG